MGLFCWWWGHKPYVFHKGWYVPYKERKKVFGVSVHCARCCKQMGFERFGGEVDDATALKLFDRGDI